MYLSLICNDLISREADFFFLFHCHLGFFCELPVHIICPLFDWNVLFIFISKSFSDHRNIVIYFLCLFKHFFRVAVCLFLYFYRTESVYLVKAYVIKLISFYYFHVKNSSPSKNLIIPHMFSQFFIPFFSLLTPQIIRNFYFYIRC